MKAGQVRSEVLVFMLSPLALRIKSEVASFTTSLQSLCLLLYSAGCHPTAFGPRGGHVYAIQYHGKGLEEHYQEEPARPEKHHALAL